MNKKKLFFIFLALGSFFSIQAQVGINTETPGKGAYLDISGNAGGLLPPRMTTTERNTNLNPKQPGEGMLIYNTDESSLQQNISKTTTPNWVNIGANQTSNASVDWFYAPPVALNISTPQAVNVYDAYKSQFTSNSLTYYLASELEFYVLGYDTAVFNTVTIAADGKLTYTLQADAAKNAGSQTYLTVIFRIKAK